VDILGTRIESPSTRDKVGTVEVVSARAVAPLTDLLGLAYPFWGPGTVGLFLKGRDVEKEVEAARQAWEFELELKPSLTDSSGRIARIRNLKPRAKPA
jgi:16S rRNA (guanine527-N7)-methyltransferase